MVSAARKYLPINPLLPALQFSTNDTIDKFYECKTMCEMRVMLTYLFPSAAIIDSHLYQRT